MDFWSLIFHILKKNGIEGFDDAQTQDSKPPIAQYDLIRNDYFNTSYTIQKNIKDLIKGNEDYMVYVEKTFGGKISQQGIEDHKKYCQEQIDFNPDKPELIESIKEEMKQISHIEKTIEQMDSLKVWQQQAQEFLKESDYQNFAMNDISKDNSPDMNYDEFLNQFRTLKFYMQDEMESYMTLMQELKSIWEKVGIDIDE